MNAPAPATCANCACWSVKQKVSPHGCDQWGACRRHAPRINNEALRRVVAVEGLGAQSEMSFDHLQLATLWPVTEARMGCEEHLRAASAAYRPIPGACTSSPTQTGAWDAALAKARAAEAAYALATERDEEAERQLAALSEPLQPSGVREMDWASRYFQLHFMKLEDVAGLYDPPHGERLGGGATMAARVADYREKHYAIKDQLRIDASTRAVADAVNEARKAHDAAISTPAPTLGALTDKIGLMVGQDVSGEHVENLLADARRLAGKA